MLLLLFALLAAFVLLDAGVHHPLRLDSSLQRKIVPFFRYRSFVHRREGTIFRKSVVGGRSRDIRF